MPVDGSNNDTSNESWSSPDERTVLAATLSANLVYDLRTRRERVVSLGRYYLQWAPHERGLQVELVSDRFLAEADRLTAFGEGRMRALGFYAPTDDAPNWTLLLEYDWLAMELADTVVTALLEVYRVPLGAIAAAVGPLPPFENLPGRSDAANTEKSFAHPLAIRKRDPEMDTDRDDVADRPTGYDSRHWARMALDMLECAQRLEWYVSGSSEEAPIATDEVDVSRLREAAYVLRRRVPIHGLLSLGIVDDGLCDEDLMWLLREHLAGRNPGIPDGGPDIRRPLRRLRRSLARDEG